MAGDRYRNRGPGQRRGRGRDHQDDYGPPFSEHEPPRRQSRGGSRGRDHGHNDRSDSEYRGGSEDRTGSGPLDEDPHGEVHERDDLSRYGPYSDFNWPMGGGYGGSRYGMHNPDQFGPSEHHGGPRRRHRGYEARRGAGYKYGEGGRGRGEPDRGIMDRATDEISSWFGDESAGRRREEDHRGKGPRGYRRSDTRIDEDVNDRLSDDPSLDATDIQVTVAEGEVTLDGEVDSKFAKRRAEDCADSVSGVQHVQNNLRIKRGKPDSDSSSKVNSNS